LTKFYGRKSTILGKAGVDVIDEVVLYDEFAFLIVLNGRGTYRVAEAR
jgi:hypothetical protein